MANKNSWLLAAGLIFFFTIGLEFITGIFGRPINVLGSTLGAQITDFLVFFMIFVVIWASGALDYLKRKSPL